MGMHPSTEVREQILRQVCMMLLMRESIDLTRSLPTWERVEAASHAIDPVFLRTPLTRHHTLDQALGCRLVAKVETLNPIRSFKGRGASWFMASTSQDSSIPLVTSSAGNFGQGLAYAARTRGRDLVIFAATTANPVKISAMKHLGATVILQGDDFDAAKDAALAYASEVGGRLVIDGDEPCIAEGAGTIAQELTSQRSEGHLDAVLLPLGNGALVTGVGTWLRHEWPATQVIAIASSGAPAMARSWARAEIIETATTDTIADGVAVRVPIPYALASMAGTVDDVILVDDAAIVDAMRLIHRCLGIVTEPAGAVGIASILADPQRWQGLSVGTVLCGANIDPAKMSEWLAMPDSSH